MDTTRVSITMDQVAAKRKINSLLQRAAESWAQYNNSRGKSPDNSDKYYQQALDIAKREAAKLGYTVKFDYPGLYPTFEVFSAAGTHFCEYNAESFFKRINGFWD